jgi:hypothetical protein
MMEFSKVICNVRWPPLNGSSHFPSAGTGKGVEAKFADHAPVYSVIANNDWPVIEE